MEINGEEEAQAFEAANRREWDQATPAAQSLAKEFWAMIRWQKKAGRIFTGMNEYAIEWLEFCGVPPEEAVRGAPQIVAAWEAQLKRKLD
jgi:hypothetical protein